MHCHFARLSLSSAARIVSRKSAAFRHRKVSLIHLPVTHNKSSFPKVITRLKTFAFTGFLALLLGAGSAFADAILSVGSTTGTPGSTVLVPVSIASDTNVVALQFDLLYDSNFLTPGAAIGGPALADQLYTNNIVSNSVYRVLIFTLSYVPMTNGAIIYVPVTIATNAPDLDEPLSLANYLLLAGMQLATVPTTSTPGFLTIAVPPAFSSISVSNGIVHLVLSGSTGRSYVIQSTPSLDGSPQWTGVYTNVATNGLLTFDDSLGASAQRFYRVMLAP